MAISSHLRDDHIRVVTVDYPPVNAVPVAGWFLEGRGNSIVLLLHGIRSDRRQMLARARFLNQAGHAVLLIDLPGHGASPAPAITFGLNESEAVRSSLAWLRRRQPQARVGVIGVSLGAASLVLCRACPRPDAVVLESMYPTIEEAVAGFRQRAEGLLQRPAGSMPRSAPAPSYGKWPARPTRTCTSTPPPLTRCA